MSPLLRECAKALTQQLQKGKKKTSSSGQSKPLETAVMITLKINES